MNPKPKIAENYKEHLATLASRPEFKAFDKLLEINERNVILKAFKINSADPFLAVKKANCEGQLFMLRQIKRTFEEAVKSAQNAQ